MLYAKKQLVCVDQKIYGSYREGINKKLLRAWMHWIGNNVNYCLTITSSIYGTNFNMWDGARPDLTCYIYNCNMVPLNIYPKMSAFLLQHNLECVLYYETDIEICNCPFNDCRRVKRSVSRSMGRNMIDMVIVFWIYSIVSLLTHCCIIALKSLSTLFSFK
jgi:hypothetical protein